MGWTQDIVQAFGNLLTAAKVQQIADNTFFNMANVQLDMVNLIIDNDEDANQTTVDVDADNLTVEEYPLTGINLTISILALGANGLDTGSIQSAEWYYIYVIYNPSTVTTAGLFSLSSTSPTMPAGYTRKRRIGAVNAHNDVGDGIRWIYQQGKKVFVARKFFVITEQARTLVDISSVVPPIAKRVSGYIESDPPKNFFSLYPSTNTNSTGQKLFSGESPGTGAWGSPFEGLEMKTPQTIYASYQLSGSTCVIFITGYEID